MVLKLEQVELGLEARRSKGLRKCVAYKTVMSRRFGKPVRRCAKFQPLR